MKIFRTRAFGVRIVLFLLVLCSSLSASSQGWLNNSATFTLSPHWNLKFTQEIRTFDVTYADPYLHNLQAGIVCKLPRNVYVALLYKREHVAYDDISLDENRTTIEGGWKTGVIKDLDFDIRARTEIRRFNLEDSNHTRFRLRLRLKYTTAIGSLKIKPFIATETFGKDTFYTVQKNRFYLGSIFPLSKHVELIVNYIWLNSRGSEDVHIINTGFDLKF